MRGVEPVFVLNRELPPRKDGRYDTLEICLAAEQVSGLETILGAQEIRGLWRIYPLTHQARDTLLLSGIPLRNCTVQAHAVNPFILRDGGNEVHATKVWISDVPISVDGRDIETALVRLGCVLRSSLMYEKTRNKDGKLTRFLTGRRFVYINTPTKPLEKVVKFGGLSARLYHKEQPKNDHQQIVCSKCLERGHKAFQCENVVKCRVCRQEGHKRGDPMCHLLLPPSVGEALAGFDPNVQNTDLVDKADQREDVEKEVQGELPRTPGTSSSGRQLHSTHKKRTESINRGRDLIRAVRSGTVQTSLPYSVRSRSCTPKRSRPEIEDSPEQLNSAKQAKPYEISPCGSDICTEKEDVAGRLDT